VRTLPCSLLFLVATVSVSFSQSIRTAGPNRAPLAPTTPSYCHPCLFYGGDMDPTNPLTNGLGSEQVLQTAPYTTAVFVPFEVPSGEQWTVGSIFVNLLSVANVVDPARAAYSISTGVSRGNGGTTITSGTGPVTYLPTGRSWNGYTEYTLLANIHATVLQPGTYWLSLVARCTNPKDQTCQVAQYYVSDVEDDPPLNHVGPFEPLNDSYFSGANQDAFFVPTWGIRGACDGLGCNRFSAGVIGTAQSAGD
jgi:hypothetical protein